MPNIFISYRRNDSRHATGRISDRLADHFGEDSVFIDIETIPLGIDFREYVQDRLEQCDVVLAIMGDNWLIDGKEPSKNTRIELATALERGDIPIIPILVGDSPVPSENQLPDDLKELSYRNGLKLHADRGFNEGMRSLIEAIERKFQTNTAGPADTPRNMPEQTAAKPKKKSRGKLLLLGIVAVGLLLGGAYFMGFMPTKGGESSDSFIDISQGTTEPFRLDPRSARVFEFVPDSSGIYSIAVISSPNYVDQGWELYTNTGDDPLVECDDDSPQRGTETCEAELQSGQVYELEVANLTGDQVNEPSESVYFTITIEKL